VTLVSGADRVTVPITALLQLAITPLREPGRVELRARFPAETGPSEVQEMLSEQVNVPTRYPPHIGLEELDRDELVMSDRRRARAAQDGARLASEILEVTHSNARVRTRRAWSNSGVAALL